MGLMDRKMYYFAGELLLLNMSHMPKLQENEDDSPQLPFLNTHEAKLMLSSKKKKVQESPSKVTDGAANDSLIESPKLPALKTVNLQSLLKSKGTVL